ncbi:MAG: hypothetical protein JW795_04260 [Chitinivibrionales bacterium]|nr:hypothetical protein [Chitinivibrionales bacterium]
MILYKIQSRSIMMAVLCIVGCLGATVPAEPTAAASKTNLTFGRFQPQTLWRIIDTNFEFLPYYHFDFDLNTFFFHKNEIFKTRYFLENNTNLEFSFISFRDVLYSVWNVQFQNGMGQTPGNIVFDPMDINFGIIPSIEVRLKLVNCVIGLDHHCFHEIDKKEFMTVYYNRPYVMVSSKNMRRFEFWNNLVEKKSWSYSDRLSWAGSFGLYARSFFGLVRPRKINGNNPILWDLQTQLRYAFYNRRSWIFDAISTTTIGYYSDSLSPTVSEGMLWQQISGIEVNFKRGKKGAMFYLQYTLDALPLYQGLPRFSKDQLLQFGIRFFL